MVERVEAMVGDAVAESPARTFTTETTPTKEQVEQWLDAFGAELNLELELHGYPSPVLLADDPHDWRLLRDANSAAAASRVLQVMPLAAFVSPDQEGQGGGRSQTLMARFRAALKRVQDHKMTASRTSTDAFESYAGSSRTSRSGSTKYPVFKRGMLEYPGTWTRTS